MKNWANFATPGSRRKGVCGKISMALKRSGGRSPKGGSGGVLSSGGDLVSYFWIPNHFSIFLLINALCASFEFWLQIYLFVLGRYFSILSILDLVPMDFNAKVDILYHFIDLFNTKPPKTATLSSFKCYCTIYIVSAIKSISFGSFTVPCGLYRCSVISRESWCSNSVTDEIALIMLSTFSSRLRAVSFLI